MYLLKLYGLQQAWTQIPDISRCIPLDCWTDAWVHAQQVRCCDCQCASLMRFAFTPFFQLIVMTLPQVWIHMIPHILSRAESKTRCTSVLLSWYRYIYSKCNVAKAGLSKEFQGYFLWYHRHFSPYPRVLLWNWNKALTAFQDCDKSGKFWWNEHTFELLYCICRDEKARKDNGLWNDLHYQLHMENRVNAQSCHWKKIIQSKKIKAV
jgi:hypothetical protein